MFGRLMRARGLEDVSPAVKFAVGPVISRLQRGRGNAVRPVDDVARVVEIPVVRHEAPLRGHLRVKLRAGIRRQDVERRGGNAALDRPIDGALEYVAILAV